MKQLVMAGMFDARLQAMAKELRAMEPGVLDRESLLALHEQTCRLLQPPPAKADAYVANYGAPQEAHEG